MSMGRFISLFAAGGVLVPLAFQMVWWVVSRYPALELKLGLVLQKLMLVFWPSSLMVLPAGSDGSLLLVALLISIIVNLVLNVVRLLLVLFAGVGFYLLAWALYRVKLVTPSEEFGGKRLLTQKEKAAHAI